MNLNHFIISGNVTRDLELRQLASRTAVVTYTVASNFVRYDAEGKKHERADFIPVTTFGKQAERDAQFLRKGSPVIVEGRIESWFDPETRRGGFNFVARNVEYASRANTEPRSGEPRNDDRQSNEPTGQGEDDWVRSYDDAERAGTAVR